LGQLSDSNRCKQPINATFDSAELDPKIRIDMTQTGWPQARTFQNVEFQSAESNTSAGLIVYWKIPKPYTSCHYVLMQEWDQGPGNYGKIRVPQGYGKTVLDVSESGCYYSLFFLSGKYYDTYLLLNGANLS
jgi:hypothetical protein